MTPTNFIVDTAKLNTGFSIPMVGLGTYKIVGQDKITIAVDAALKAGYRLFDTAKYYVNEAELGIALQYQTRVRYFCCGSDMHGTASKIQLEERRRFHHYKIFLAETNNADHARKMTDESLKNLQTKYLDLVLIHYPKANGSENNDPRNPENRKDAYLELEKLKNEHKVRSIGVSNYEIKHIKEIQDFGQMMPSAYSSLARNHPDLMHDFTIVEAAKAHNSTPQLVVLAWALNLGVGIIPKSANSERIINNFKA
ncbi:Aldose reductase B [Dirofilaria immitis]|nr:Aldose reductase B [Dirofilaria immitis]